MDKRESKKLHCEFCCDCIRKINIYRVVWTLRFNVNTQRPFEDRTENAQKAICYIWTWVGKIGCNRKKSISKNMRQVIIISPLRCASTIFREWHKWRATWGHQSFDQIYYIIFILVQDVVITIAIDFNLFASWTFIIIGNAINVPANATLYTSNTNAQVPWH